MPNEEGIALIYLDNAATTWPKPEEVYQAVDGCLRKTAGNPGRGGHQTARQAGYVLYEAREELGSLFNVEDPNRIVFTHNATDAMNMALFGLLHSGDYVVTTSMEHNAVARPLHELAARGIQVIVISCDQQGRLNMGQLKEALACKPRAIIATHASNVTGTLMPVAEIGQLARQQGAAFIMDASQTAGLEEIDVDQNGIDLLVFSGHKSLLGIQGTGGLFVREGISLTPLRFGGTGSLSESDTQPDFMPDCLESGTPNTPGIAGLLAGVRYIKKQGMVNIRRHEKRLAEALIGGLNEIPGVQLYGPQNTAERTAVVSFTLRNMDSGWVAHRLDQEYGIACRAGLHCAAWAHRTIGTVSTGTVRLSPGYFNNAKDIAAAIEAIRLLAAKVV